MAMTPASSTAAYCTNAQALVFFDQSVWGDLCSNSGTRLTPTQLATDTTLTTLLLEATGQIEEAVSCGGRYKVADLQALQASTTAGGIFLARMVATIAFWTATQRRYPQTIMPEGIQRVYDAINMLRSGIGIFSFLETQAAGLASTERWYESLNDLWDSPVWEARRMFGNRHLTSF